MEHRTARRFVISGNVQGVGYRAFARQAARSIGATGWARNLANGDVTTSPFAKLFLELFVK